MVMLLYFRLFVIGYSSLCVNSLIKHHRFRLATSSLFARSQRTMAAATRPVEAWLDATVSSVDRTVLESLFHSSGDKSLFVDSMLTLQDDSNSISDLLTGFSDKFHNKSPQQYIQDRARSLVGSVEWIVLHCVGDWTMIPVENLIAACTNTGTKLAVFVDKVTHLPGVYYALQTGPDAVILSPNKELWDAYATLRVQSIGHGVDTSSAIDYEENDHDNDTGGDLLKTTVGGTATSESTVGCLDEAIITEVKGGMIGDRICLDLIQSLEDGEGNHRHTPTHTHTHSHTHTHTYPFIPF